MIRQLTPETEDLWRALIGLPEGAAYPRMQKLWLQKFSMDYGAEAVCAALMTCGKMGWNSLKSVEGVLLGKLSENTRDGQVKPGMSGAIKAPAPGINQELIRLGSELNSLHQAYQSEKENLETLRELTGKSLDDLEKEYKSLLQFRTRITPESFEKYLENLDLATLETRVSASSQKLTELTRRIYAINQKMKELKNG